MALSNLSHVTRTMIALLSEAFVVSDAWGGEAPTILPESPSRITQDGLGFYLYHVEENSAYKNLPAPGGSRSGVRFTNLGLTLYYQLSANSLLNVESEGAFDEQTMMGIAMKVLHDYPNITDNTRLNGVQVMHSLLRGRNNHFKISLQPVPYTEAVQFWTAGTAPMKLSAYYQLKTVLLEPEDIQTRVGRVLVYGAHTFVNGAPKIISSQNRQNYTILGETTVRQVKIQPAQAPPNDLPNSQITFWGSGLQGDFVELLLLGQWNSWNNQVAIADTSWGLSVQNQVVTVDVQETIVLETGTAVDVLPGIYGVQLRVIRNRTMPDGQTKSFVHLSNQVPITISPRIDSITPPNANIFFAVTGYRWQHVDLDSEMIQVYLGEVQLNVGNPAGLASGEFGIFNATELRFRPPPPSIPPAPAAFRSGQILPLRIFVNRVESAPRWITIP